MAPTTPANAPRPYRSTLPGGDGFGRLLRAEWVKLRSVPRWRLALLAAVFLTVAAALLTARGTSSEQAGDSGGGSGSGQLDEEKRDPLSQVRDGGLFVHRPMSGAGSVIARVTGQADGRAGGQGRAKAGLMIRESLRTGAPYAAIVVTPEHGVRLHAGYTTDIAGGAATAPRWLKLTRTGTSVAGFESADGVTWTQVGKVRLAGLPAAAPVGMYVGSPNDLKIERQFGGESISETPTDGKATFDNVRVESAGAQPAAPWRARDRSSDPAGGGFTRAGGTYTLAGSGDIGVDEAAEDTTRTMLTGVLLGLLAVVAVAVLFITAEFGRGTIRTTFAATPRRGRVLAAKAIVVGGAAFVTGLAGAFGAFLLAGPIMRSNGLAPADLTAGPVLRALIGTGAILAAVAVFSLGVATVVRRSAAAISLVLLLVLLPQIIATGLPLSAAKWLERLTPAAGFAMQQTVHRYDTAIGPWAGLGVLCCYAAAALAAAHWRLRRRDA